MADSVLALDLGTLCGWALADLNLRAVVGSGVWDCRENRFEGRGMRFLKFRQRVDEIHRSSPLRFVVVEEVARHVGTAAAHIYGGFLAQAQVWCEQNGVAYTATHFATIKKWATGKGNAKKEAMLQAARDKWPLVEIVDDNQADAMWIAEHALVTYS